MRAPGYAFYKTAGSIVGDAGADLALRPKTGEPDGFGPSHPPDRPELLAIFDHTYPVDSRCFVHVRPAITGRVAVAAGRCELQLDHHGDRRKHGPGKRE